jgi:hypothetical protein
MSSESASLGMISEPAEQHLLPKSPIVAAPRAHTDSPRIRLTRKQSIGLPLLALVPILALLGTFGDRERTIAVASPSLGITINYPDRMRYRQRELLEISVVNRGVRALDTVLVSVDTSYLSRFIDVRGTPPPTTNFSVPLLGVQPGESRLLSVELTGNRYWRHPATVSAATGPERTTVAFSTLVFP